MKSIFSVISEVISGIIDLYQIDDTVCLALVYRCTGEAMFQK